MANSQAIDIQPYFINSSLLQGGAAAQVVPGRADLMLITFRHGGSLVKFTATKQQFLAIMAYVDAIKPPAVTSVE
ncbi:Protein of unknown function [Pyronema omphalodes CBS 100304]|uniref:Uncharacterized protein n=1 Tax=Pyronema omphalodes (strain CBS 100304) TaxID=1076935 RepID=U4LGU6_PYROM|nr:Protein of unknown function [Pyronema omphalodes CBS 100304]